jgi:DNA polymerase III subunit chi
MTRVDFHTNVPDKLAYACRLVRKASAAGNRIVLLMDDAAQQRELDAQLWSFAPAEFLPHVAAGDALAAQTPIILACDDDAPLPHTELLVNLSRRMPAAFARFDRVIEVVSAEETDAAAGRQRYKAYKQQDYQPTHFVANKS